MHTDLWYQGVRNVSFSEKMAYVLNGCLTHIKIRELFIKKNFNSTEIN